MYNRTFFDYVDQGARPSAAVVTSHVFQLLGVKSVLDVGCGRGTWLASWMALGVADIFGLDGSYVPVESLAIPPKNFRAVNLSHAVDLGRRFDLVQSLEVAEHLPPAAGETFVSTLTQHGDLILFSAARPGQGGKNHLNERPYAYWRRLFSDRGYGMYDAVRPYVNEPEVEPWYRYNSFLFVGERAVPRLPASVRVTRIGNEDSVPDVAPWSWQLRCHALRMIPAPLVNYLAFVKHHATLGWRHFVSHEPL